jgi:autotransporter-associated beta strand protein
MSGTPSDRNIDLVGVLAPADITVTFPGATTLPLTNGFDFIANAAGKSVAATGNLTLNSASVAFQNTAGSGTVNMANTVGGNLLYNGGNILALPGTNALRNVTLTVTGNLAAASAGNTLLVSTEGNTPGTLTISGTKPTVTNGMISAGIQYGMSSANALADFATFSGNNLASASSSYVSYAAAADWSGAASTEIVNLTGAITLSGSGDMNIHALRVASGAQNLGGRTVNLGSGGLITTNVAISNGTLDFGSGPGFIGAYNAGSQSIISASLAGSGGITIMGNSQSLDLNSANSFSGGFFINNGRVSLGNATAVGSSNNVTVSAFGELNTDVSTAGGAVIGGLSGSGTVAADFASTGNRILAITPASGTHTFTGIITNGVAGKVLSIIKDGAGTQIFTGNNTYTGATLVNNGTLIIDGTLSASATTVTSTLTDTAILAGHGTVQAITLAGGAGFGGVLDISAATGSALGDLNATSLAWNGTTGSAFSQLKFDLSGDSAASDQLVLSGAMTKGTGDFFRFDFGNTGDASVARPYTLVTALGGFGTFAATDFTYTGLSSGVTGSFEINGNNLNFVTVIPEPGTWVLLGIAASFLLWRRRSSL